MLTSFIQDVPGLDLATRADMYALFKHYYLDTTPAQFARDLDDKQTAFLLRDVEGRLCGFSTLKLLVMEIDGIPLRIVFSGDTIIDRAHWGSPVFAYAWIRHIGQLKAQVPLMPLYWLLIVKGHRTWRYLPTFGLDFVPDWRSREHVALHRLKDAVAAQYFGPAYDPASGIVRHVRPGGHLAPQWAQVSAREARRADVQFFLHANPGYAQGDELVCLCALEPANMRPLTRRLFLQGAAA